MSHPNEIPGTEGEGGLAGAGPWHPIDFDYNTPLDAAPANAHWHRTYAKGMALVTQMLEKIQKADGYEDAEYLGDYVQTVHNLLTFRPMTLPEIEADARGEVYNIDPNFILENME